MSRPKHWSYSQFTTLLECGEKYRLTKLCRAPETPSVWLCGGSAFHEVTEAYDRGFLESGIDSPAEVFDRIFQHEVEQQRETHPDVSEWRCAGRKTKEKPNGEDLDWWRVAGPAMVDSYIAWREGSDLEIAELPDGQPAIEVKFEVEIGGAPVQGAIDRVLVDTNTGEYALMDLKTGTRVPETVLQLGVYRVAWQQMMGQDIDHGTFYMARKGELTMPADLRTFTKERLDREFGIATKMRDANLFLPHRTSLCKTCSVSEYCTATGGALADVYANVGVEG